MQAIPNPLINITLQGRYDTYPKRRGMTRVPELRAAGVNVGFGHDCVMDPWYPLGSGDALEVAHMALHVAMMTSREAMRWCFDAVTVNPAKIMGLEGYGLEPGCNADFVVLQAGRSDRGDPPEGAAAVRGTAGQGDRRGHAARLGARPAGPAGTGRSERLCAAGGVGGGARREHPSRLAARSTSRMRFLFIEMRPHPEVLGQSPSLEGC